MSRTEKLKYITRLLELMTDKQKHIFSLCFPEGIPSNNTNLDHAVRLLEETLKKANMDSEKEFEYKKKYEEYVSETDALIQSLNEEIFTLEDELASLESELDSTYEEEASSRYVQRRLEKLDALEAAGVDNWEGYDYAMSEMRD